jgi:uncharacterized protein YndB with AHSA1/START domain
MKTKTEPIIVEQSFEVSREQVWRAITELHQMKQWFFEQIEAYEPKVGFETRFVVELDHRVFPHLWKITELEPHTMITYNWKYEGYTGDSFVTFELSDLGNATLLRLTHRIAENFPPDIPEFSRKNCENGWNWFIKQSLKDYLLSAGKAH